MGCLGLPLGFINVTWVKAFCMLALFDWHLKCRWEPCLWWQGPLSSAFSHGMRDELSPGVDWEVSEQTCPLFLAGMQGGKNSNDQECCICYWISGESFWKQGATRKVSEKHFCTQGAQPCIQGVCHKVAGTYLMLHQHYWGSLKEAHCCSPFAGGAWGISQFQPCLHKMLVSIPAVFLFIVP